MSETRSLTVERVFDATPQELFAAWTDPAQLKVWYHPVPGLELVVHAFEPRLHGRVHYDMPLPGRAKGHETKGKFHVFDPPHRLAFGADDKSELTEVTLTPIGAKTRMTVVWTSNRPEMTSPDFQQGARLAWESSARKLDQLLAG